MIVISGALVLVALVLLVVGLVTTSLPLVYASIAVSVVSFAFLLVGILQRRKDKLPGELTAPTPAPTRAPPPAPTPAPASPPAPAAAATPTPAPTSAPEPAPAVQSKPELAAQPTSTLVEPAPALAHDVDAHEVDIVPTAGVVLVVPGRPRYHVAGCRYLSGRQADEQDAQAARRDGFTACGVCRPDDLLVEEAAAEPHPRPEPEPVPEPVVAARRTTRAAAANAPGRVAALAKAPGRVAAPAKAPGHSPSVGVSPRRTATVPPLLPAGQDDGAAPAAPRRGSVVVIPDRGRFHRAECRYVRGADNAQSMSKAQAARQGYEACGVCLP